MGRVPRHPLAPYAAHLRVYEPIEVLVPAGLAAEPAHGRRGGHDTRIEESRRSLLLAAATPPVVVPEQESRESHALEIDGRTYLCPWQTRLRSWQALEALRRALPDPLLQMLLSPAVTGRLEADDDRWRAEHLEQVPHILTATWHVPLRWFVFFGPDERRVEITEQGRSLRYRTPMSAARRRGALALRTLRRTLVEGPLVDGVEDLGRWLEEFHPRSWVELDYGGLGTLLDDDALAADTSVADVSEALDLLADGHPAEAATGYERLMSRWREVQALEHAN